MLIEKLRSSGYSITNFSSLDYISGPHAIIRHDVDLSPAKAEMLAWREQGLNFHSTYFFMVSSPWYNLLEKENEQALRKIQEYGHEIGLHFDASKYTGQDLIPCIKRELKILEAITGSPVKSFSWHIPVKKMLGRKLVALDEIGVRNAYDPKFYKGHKYLSDSMMRWRENPEEFLDTHRFPRLQILTHPVWYSEYGNLGDLGILDSLMNGKVSANVAYLEAIRPGYSQFK